MCNGKFWPEWSKIAKFGIEPQTMHPISHSKFQVIISKALVFRANFLFFHRPILSIFFFWYNGIFCSPIQFLLLVQWNILTNQIDQPATPSLWCHITVLYRWWSHMIPNMIPIAYIVWTQYLPKYSNVWYVDQSKQPVLQIPFLHLSAPKFQRSDSNTYSFHVENMKTIACIVLSEYLHEPHDSLLPTVCLHYDSLPARYRLALKQGWPTRGTRASCGSLAGFMWLSQPLGAL